MDAMVQLMSAAPFTWIELSRRLEIGIDRF